MKRLLIMALFCLATATQLSYAFQLPTDKDGEPANRLEEYYVNYLTVRYSATASGVKGSSIAIHGVLTSTKTASSDSQEWVELRATDTANTSSQLLCPPIMIATTTKNTFKVFDPPLIAPDGLSVNLSSAGTIATVFYTFLASNTVDGTWWIPYDSKQNMKVSDPRMYGVKVASEVTAGSSVSRIGAAAIDHSTQTIVVSTNASLLYGFMSSSGSTTNFVKFEDSNTVTGAELLLFPPLFYNAMTYVDTLSNEETKVFKFPFAVRLIYGLTQIRNVNSDRFRIFLRRTDTLRY